MVSRYLAEAEFARHPLSDCCQRRCNPAAICAKPRLTPQHLHLALLQRHGALAMRAGELDGGQQLRMAFKEARCVHQIIGDLFFGDALQGHVGSCLIWMDVDE